MIRTIVVDDEKLVRRGFISLIDWEAYGMKIVGEAGDGKSAMDLLSRVETDLVITDITMPGMSGFDLIGQVRSRYPHIWTVVLTCHHEFDYVQEALRIGAIDYIVKTLIEMDSIGDVMNRIVHRIRTEEQIRQAVVQTAGDTAAASLSVNEALVILSSGSGEGGGKEALRHYYGGLEELGDQNAPIWFIPLRQQSSVGDIEQELRKLGVTETRSVVLTDLASVPLSILRAAVSERIRDWLFYEWKPDGMLMKIPYSELPALPEAPSDEEWKPSEHSAMELRWALHHADWDSFIAYVEASRPKESQIRELGRRIAMEWDEWFHWSTEAPHLIHETSRMASWGQWRRWLRELAHEIVRRAAELELSREVMGSLVKAVLYMTNRLGDGDALNQESVALYVNMSRSYFSQCFKRFAGKPFGDVLRDMRLRKAAELLADTNDPVYEIAARVGFEDEKYFSKMFRGKHGMLPSEFRSSKVKGKNFVY